MKAFLRAVLLRLWRRLQPKPDIHTVRAELNVYKAILNNMPLEERVGFVRFASVAAEMIEAKLMCGSGPRFSSPGPELVAEADNAIKRIYDGALGLREGGANISSQGAFGDIELALANVEWRREINLSWLEFSRWGIQQIILISRLYYIKNPLMRRAIDVCAVYVFGRGVEVTSTDADASDVLKEFFERNKKTLGPTAMLMLERAKYTDGNVFFAFFADEESTGIVSVNTIDATEIQEVIMDPDTGDEILFKRIWAVKTFEPKSGATALEQRTRWYPALGWEPPAGYPDTIANAPIEWDVTVMHRMCGAVAKWSMGCPLAYPAVEWAKTSKEYLEACLTVAQSHAQFAWSITTKGGQNALQAVKNQLQTTVNAAPMNSLWDTNPTPVDGSIFASGPGTKLTPTLTRGAGIDPSEVKEYRNMVGMTFGIPPTWLGDMETANLSTATTLDRPTELGFRAKQIQWEEDLATIAKFVLEVSGKATAGKLREAWIKKSRAGKTICITEASKKTLGDGRRVYDEAVKPKDDEVLVRVTFPAIREGDMTAIIKATVEAMTLENKGGQIVGIDERAGVRLLFEALGVEDTEELLNEMYPEKEYDPNRTKEDLPAPIPKLQDAPGGEPQLQAAPPGTVPATERQLRKLLKAVVGLKRAS